MLTFKRRYLFTGCLMLKTGLHIGGGEIGLGASGSLVVRTPDGKPYIPGSSFKGAFRSTVESLAPLVGLRSCGLMAGQGCPGAQGSEQDAFNRRRRAENWRDRDIIRHLQGGISIDGQTIRLCDTCWLFGSPFTASRIFFSDLYLGGDEEGIVQVRDGVAIDRDSERAVEGLLYDYEVVAPTQVFQMEVWLEDPTDTDVGLICLGLSEFLSEFGGLGGHRSRGLGRCQITDLEIYELDLTVDDLEERAKRLRKYLLGRTPADKMTRIEDPQDFINRQIEALFYKEADHAEKGSQ
jgi:CRISPR-associated RAMP protein (TIGR02581 family)